jgi:hypothetical protein
VALSYTYSTVATSVTVNVPTGNAGDVVIIVTEDGDAPSALSAPGGWTAVSAMYSHPSSNVRTRAWYQIMPSTTGGNVTTTHTGAGGSAVTSAVRIAGAHATTPLTGLADPTSGGTISGTGASAPSVSINTGEDHLIICLTDDTGSNNTGPSGSSPTYTETKEQNGQSYYVGTYASTTTTGTRTVTSTSPPVVLYSFAVVPAGGAAATSPAPRPRRAGIPVALLNR